MNIIQQAKAKLKPPPPPPKPSHLSQPTNSTPSQTTNTTSPARLKRGLGWPWDAQSVTFPLFTTTTKITWLFNWELWVPPSLSQSIEWVPCVRTAAQCNDITPFLTDISGQGRPITAFLGFNEPEIPSQANMTVDEAVRLWREFVLPAKTNLGFRLGSPSVSSDVSKCVAWLDGFFEQLGGVAGSGVEFLVLHWYGLHFGDMRGFLEMMYQRYRLPIWLNEFACSRMGSGEVSEREVERFLREAVPWLDGCEWVERYAYFGLGQGQDVGTWVGHANNFIRAESGCEDTGNMALSPIGKLYLAL